MTSPLTPVMQHSSEVVYCLGMFEIQAWPDCFWRYWFIKSQDMRSRSESTNTKGFCLVTEKTKYLLVLLRAVYPPACCLFLTPAVPIFMTQRAKLQQGRHWYQSWTSQVRNKECCAGLQTCLQSSKHCSLGEKQIPTVLFVPLSSKPMHCGNVLLIAERQNSLGQWSLQLYFSS